MESLPLTLLIPIGLPRRERAPQFAISQPADRSRRSGKDRIGMTTPDTRRHSSRSRYGPADQYRVKGSETATPVPPRRFRGSSQIYGAKSRPVQGRCPATAAKYRIAAPIRTPVPPNPDRHAPHPAEASALAGRDRRHACRLIRTSETAAAPGFGRCRIARRGLPPGQAALVASLAGSSGRFSITWSTRPNSFAEVAVMKLSRSRASSISLTVRPVCWT